MIPTLPRNIGVIHFVGIGGIGMSGIAEVLHNLGYKVKGSDIADSANVKRLVQQGIEVSVGHKADNLGGAEVVVISSAVKPDNPEVVAARAKLIPVVRRAEMLAELMRLKWSISVGGTHGKTTTTSLVAALMESAGYDPTVINGGIINSYGTNTRLGAGDWMVVEADESDGTFVKLPSTITVVTNMDPEHMDHYHTFDAMRRAYDQFVSNIPFYGFAVLCVDHPEVQTMIGRLSDRKIVTYGFSKQADVRATNVRIVPGIIKYDVTIKSRRGGPAATMRDMELSMVGEHNVQNSLAAVAIAWELGIEEKKLRDALAGFRGVKRRFTKTGEWNGITVIDDYGHHPVEIATTLKAARTATKGKVIAVVQPHRYSRLRDLFEQFCTAFNDADKVVVADVYAAGEAPIEGISGDALVAGLKSRGHRNVKKLPKPEELAALIKDIASPGDLVVCLGAGSITQWANALPEQLRALPEGKQ